MPTVTCSEQMSTPEGSAFEWMNPIMAVCKLARARVVTMPWKAG